MEGYTAKHHNAHGTPIEDWCYEEFIKGKPARLLRCVDLDAGEWEDTGIKFKNQEEAEEYMNNLDKNTVSNFQYEMIND